jgi:hypothetical protein
MHWLLILLALGLLLSVLSARRSRAARARFLAKCTDGNYGSVLSDRVKELLRDGRRIQALKQFRLETGLGLKDAKNILSQVDIDQLQF